MHTHCCINPKYKLQMSVTPYIQLFQMSISSLRYLPTLSFPESPWLIDPLFVIGWPNLRSLHASLIKLIYTSEDNLLWWTIQFQCLPLLVEKYEWLFRNVWSYSVKFYLSSELFVCNLLWIVLDCSAFIRREVWMIVQKCMIIFWQILPVFGAFCMQLGMDVSTITWKI